MAKKSKNFKLGALALLGAAASWGTMGVLVRFVNREITPFSQVLFRYVVALLLSSLPLLLKKRSFKLADKRDYLLMALVGIFGYGLTNVFYTLGVLNTTISAAVFLFSMYPIFTPALSSLFLKEKISRRLLEAVALGFLGAVFIFNPTGLMQNFKGNVFSLIGCLLTSFYFVGIRKLGKRNNSEITTFYSILFGIITLLPLSFIFENPLGFKVSPFSWILVFLFALANFVAFYLVNIGFRKIEASIGSIILLMEPVFGTFYALLFFTEIPGVFTLLGAILIVASVAYLNLGANRKGLT